MNESLAAPQGGVSYPVVVEPKIVEYSPIARALGELRQRFANVVFDVKTKEGLVMAKAARAEIKGYRVALEKKRVEIKAPALERSRLIDEEAKRITAALTALEDPIDDLIKADDRAKAAAEEARQAKVRAEVERIKGIPLKFLDKGSEEIAAAQEDLDRILLNPGFFEEFFEAALLARSSALEQLGRMLRSALDDEAAEERIRLRQADLDRQEAAQRARGQEEAERRAVAQRLADEDLAARRRLLEAEEDRLAEQRRQQETADRVAREKAEAKDRAEREEQEAKDRQARLEQEERERVARAGQVERERVARVAKEEKEAKARARQGDRELLLAFRRKHPEKDEFSGIVRAIDRYFKEVP